MTQNGVHDLATIGATSIRKSRLDHKVEPILRIFHYNDVYHVEPGSREPAGGAARFQSMRNFYANDERFAHLPELVTFFSGDAFNPSLESTITKGKHMVPVLNNLGTHAACLGNHDLDFGLKQFDYLAAQCNFPWLCSNVLDPSLGDEFGLGGCKRQTIVTATNGLKIGLLGLVEQEWLDTISFLPADLQFIPPSQVATEFAPKLRAQGADIVIVLAHQRMPNDIRLAQEIDPGTIDIILGGHDHTYDFAEVNGTTILRSGTDFKQFSYIEARKTEKGWDFDILRQDVVSAVPQDPNSLAMITSITEALSAKLEKPVGFIAAPLDARFTTVRLAESNLGNLISDLMRLHYDADCCLLCGGTIRGDQVYPPGILKVKDVMNCFPFEDTCVVVRLSGEAVVEALENGVSKWPALDGRFPQISGMTFAFDPAQRIGKRCHNVHINGRPVDLKKEYTMVTRDYMCRGKDGYYVLMPKEEGGKSVVTVPEESGLMLSMLLRQYFMSLKVFGQWRNWSKTMNKHWRGIHKDLHGTHPVREPKSMTSNGDYFSDSSPTQGLLKIPKRTKYKRRYGSHRWKEDGEFHLSDSEDEPITPITPAVPQPTEQERRLMLARRAFRKWWRLTGLTGHPELVEEPGDDFGTNWTKAVAPRLEGRIQQVVRSTWT